MKNIFAVLFLAFSVCAQAQITKGEVSLTNNPDGQKIATLADSTRIAIGRQENGWYKTTTKVLVPKIAVGADSTLAAEVNFIDKNKKIVGKSLAETKVEFKQADGRGFYKYYEILITGYLKSYGIHYRSIPEKGLEEILNDPKVAGRQDRLAEFFKNNNFKKQNFGDYDAWIYLDEVASLEEPTYRTIVVFRGETMIFAVISRDETMTLDKLKDTRKSSTGVFHYYQKPSEAIEKQMQDIAYSFIPL